MRGLAIALCCGAFAVRAEAAAVRSAAPADLDGEWVGQRNGETVIWTLSEGGRLRVDGRGASYEIHGDTLAVQFDPPSGEVPGAAAETASYRLTRDETSKWIFVYGFDLGRQGVLFHRETTPEPPTAPGVIEDAAPEPPPAPASAVDPPPPGPQAAAHPPRD